jgi:hypothetical protein
MTNRKDRPSWWQLYLLGAGVVGLLVLEARASLSERGHEAAAIATLLLVFVLVELWLRANTAALMHPGRLVPTHQPASYHLYTAFGEEPGPAPCPEKAVNAPDDGRRSPSVPVTQAEDMPRERSTLAC